MTDSMLLLSSKLRRDEHVVLQHICPAHGTSAGRMEKQLCQRRSRLWVTETPVQRLDCRWEQTGATGNLHEGSDVRCGKISLAAVWKAVLKAGELVSRGCIGLEVMGAPCYMKAAGAVDTEKGGQGKC